MREAAEINDEMADHACHEADKRAECQDGGGHFSLPFCLSSEVSRSRAVRKTTGSDLQANLNIVCNCGRGLDFEVDVERHRVSGTLERLAKLHGLTLAPRRPTGRHPPNKTGEHALPPRLRAKDSQIRTGDTELLTKRRTIVSLIATEALVSGQATAVSVEIYHDLNIACYSVCVSRER